MIKKRFCGGKVLGVLGYFYKYAFTRRTGQIKELTFSCNCVFMCALQAGVTNNMLQVLPNGLRIVLSKKETGGNSGYQWRLEDKSISIHPNSANLATLRFIFFPFFFSFPGQLIGLITNRALFRDSFILRPKFVLSELLGD